MTTELISPGNNLLIAFRFSFDPLAIAKIKQLPNANWYPDLKRWAVPWSPLAAWLTLKAFPDATHEGVQESIRESGELPSSLPPILYDFQREGAAFLYEKANAILADCPGAGKTLQAIAASYLCPPVIISCPSSVKYQWCAEILRVCRKTEVQVVRSKKESIGKAEWTILSHSLLVEKHRDIIKQQPQSLIVDEAHVFRNAERRRSQAFMAVASRVPRVIPMTGTPIFNKVSDLFPLLVATKKLHQKDYWFFLQRYCDGKVVTRKTQKKTIFATQANGLTHGDELREFMASFTLRRNRQQIGKQLPPLTRETLPIDITNRQEYEETQQETKSWILTHPEPRSDESRMIRINTLRRIAAIGKVDAVVERLLLLQEAGEKAVVLCSFLEPLDLIEGAVSGSIRIDGSVSPQQRHNRIHQFQTDPRCSIALCSSEAGGVGVTLTAAHRSFILDIPWTAAQAQQEEARTYRDGQAHSTIITYVVGNDTIDLTMLSVIRKKSAWAKTIFEGGDDGYVDALSVIEKHITERYEKCLPTYRI